MARDIGKGFCGVAPGASLKIYRVFGCEVSSTDDVIISALTFAAADGVDLISISLGTQSGWSESPLSTVASKIVQAGIPIIVAAGNDGYDGAFLASSPADALGVTAVGSVDNIEDAGYVVPTVQSPPGPSSNIFLRSFICFHFKGPFL